MGYFRALLALSLALATLTTPGQAAARTDAGVEVAGEAVAQTVTFVGGGWGHAVGMSQYGAQGRALAGFSAEEIVTAYYTGTDVEPVADLPIDPAVLGVERPLWVGLSQNHATLDVGIAQGDLVICFDADCIESLDANQGEAWVITYDNSRGGCTFTRDGEPVLLPPPPEPPPPDDNGNDDGDDKPDIAPPPEDVVVGTGTDAEPAPIGDEAPPTTDPAPEAPAANPQDDPPPPPPPEPVVAPGCRLTIELDPGLVSSLGRQYGRGALELRKVPGAAQFHVSASLALDDYVLGIAEVPTSWQPAALEAQTLAARTYAFNRFLRSENVSLRTPGDPGLSTQQKSNCWCHLGDTSADQVYKGWEGEAATWVTAVNATASRVITYRGPDAASFTKSFVIEAYYSSSNGGISESNIGGFGSSTLYPYLVPVDDPYSTLETVNNGFATWEAEFSVGEVLQEVAAIEPAEPVWDQLVTVSVLEQPAEGIVRFEGISNGEYVIKDVPGWQMRRTFGLRSPQVFEVQLAGTLCAGHFPTIFGTWRSEEIVGTFGKDVIVGYGGDDTIDGLAGDDVICGGAGNDHINGGWGDDVISGGTGADNLYGGSGIDTISGGDDQDYIDGGFGDDILRGDAAFDLIHGQAGHDELFGGGGEDVLYGDGGFDVISGGPDNDALFGGLHADILSGYGGEDDLDGGDGFDDCRGGQGIDSATACELVSWVP